METPERKVKKKIIKWVEQLQKEGVKIYIEPRTVGGYTYRKGLPDYWIVLNGKHIEIEVKKEENGLLSTTQLQWQQYFKQLHITCYAVASLDEFKEVIKKES